MQDEFLLLWGSGRWRGDLCKLSRADQLTGNFLAQLRPCGVGTAPAWRPGGSKKRPRAHWTRACFPALLRLAFRGQKPQGGGRWAAWNAGMHFISKPHLWTGRQLTPLSGNLQGWPFQLSSPWLLACRLLSSSARLRNRSKKEQLEPRSLLFQRWNGTLDDIPGDLYFFLNIHPQNLKNR